MIKNDKQYQVTKNRLKDFNDALLIAEAETDIDPILKEIQVEGIKSQIVDFEREIKEYEKLKSGEVNILTLDSLSMIQEALIKARIVKGLTQAELAAKLDIQEQQIQRYEACFYSSANMPRITEIFKALDLELKPITIKIKNPDFNFLRKSNDSVIATAQRRLRERKSLLNQ